MHLKEQSKKVLFLIIFNIIFAFFIMRFFNDSLFPVIYDYGKYKCNSFMSALINYSVQTQMKEGVVNQIIDEEDGKISVNVDILNSIVCNSIMKSHQILNKLESGEIEEEFANVFDGYVDKDKIKRGIIYDIPLGRVFNNVFVSNLGINVPVRYKVIGDIHGKVVSSVKGYGINNALVELYLEVGYRSSVAIPLIVEEVEDVVKIPLVIKLVQGEIPDYLIGTNFNGGVE